MPLKACHRVSMSSEVNPSMDTLFLFTEVGALLNALMLLWPPGPLEASETLSDRWLSPPSAVKSGRRRLIDGTSPGTIDTPPFSPCAFMI
mmetsp:Transcript_8284/g.19352  ORF Transcript_8284/g.19352 Transcript_8284/m.19352 type:complete len:90 (+) Transcript_8284:4638-4907(+)